MIYFLSIVLVQNSLQFLKSNKLSINAFANVVQAIMSAVIMFVMYRYLNENLGIAMIGIWSVVIASVSSSRLIDVGFSSGAVVFISKYIALDDYKEVREITDTLAISIMVLLTILLPVLFPILAYILSYIFTGTDYDIAVKLLPYSLISAFIIITASFFQGVIDGFQKMALRATLVVCGLLFFLLLVIFLVPKYGIIGLAYSQIAQGIFLLFFSRLLIIKLVPDLKFYPKFIRFGVIKQMINYGLNIQFSSFLQLLQEPITKGLMASYGGAVIAGYFELAYQVITRVRSLIVAANNAIVPQVAYLKTLSLTKMSKAYINNQVILLIASSIIFSLLQLWSGIVSLTLTGSYPSELLLMINILIIAWGINTIASPAYLFNMGDGRVWHNTKTHLLIGVLNIFLGVLFGYLFGWLGVLLGTSTAIIIGSLYLILTHNINGKNIFNLPLKGGDYIILFICFVLYIVGWIYPFNFSEFSFLGLYIFAPIGLICFFSYKRLAFNDLIRKYF